MEPRVGRTRRILVGTAVAAAFALALLSLPATAGAVLPGVNGRIVFTSGRDDFPNTFDSNHAQLWVVNQAGGTPHRVTIQNIEHRHATWSPDGTKIAYAAGDAATGAWDIYILDLTQPASGTNPMDITNTPGVAEDRPAWSPDGTRIAYTSNIGGGSFIFVQSATGPQVTTLVSGSANAHVDKPAWSPDSQTIYYSYDVDPGPGVDDDIFKIPANSMNGAGATDVVFGPTDDYQPAVSPDGQNLCFTRGAFGTTSATVWRSTITGANQTLIANSGQGDYNCAWSPDGTKIAYVQGIFTNGDLKMKNSDGSGSATDLVPNVAGRFDGNPDWARAPLVNGIPGLPALPGVPGLTRDTTPATIASVLVSPSRWRLGSALSKISRARAPVGTTIRFGLSKPATVTLKFDKATSGRKVRRRCVAPTRSNRRRARCTRYAAAGTLTFFGHAGANRVAFQGRLSRTRKLSVGSYRLTFGATDLAGNRSRTRTAKFTIVAR